MKEHYLDESGCVYLCHDGHEAERVGVHTVRESPSTHFLSTSPAPANMTKQTVRGFVQDLHGELIDLEVKIRAINERLAYLELMGEDPGVHW